MKILGLSNSSWVLASLLGLAFADACVQNENKNTPNILCFLVDDMGWMDAGYQGSQIYQTPNIDKFAGKGVKFINAYVSHPRCVPSRYFAGGHAGAPISYFYPYNSPSHHQFKIPIRGLENGKKGEYLTDRLTDETINYLREHKKKHLHQPFFAFLSHYGVHEPFHAKKELVERFSKKIDSIHFDTPEYIEESHGYTKMRQDNAEYAAMLYSVDESFGRIMKAMKDLRQLENTLIIFYSDNGGLSNTGTEKRPLATSNYPLRAGKGHLYEGGIRVPLIVRWDGITKPGSVSDAIITGTDFFPTLLDVAGAEQRPFNHLDGESFLWALQGKQNSDKERAIYWHNSLARPLRTGDYNSTAVRKGKYKLIDFYHKGVVELYNLEKDIKEEVNIAKKLPEKTKELMGLIQQWRVEVNANMKQKASKTSVKK